MKNKTTTHPGSTILQLPSKFIGAAAKKGSHRPVLEGVFIDADNRAVVATNGVAMAMVPIPGSGTIVGGYITPELWKSATIMAKKGPVILDYSAGTVAGLPYQTMEEWGQNYANWKAVAQTEPKISYRTRLDPDVLLNAATALGWNKDSNDAKGVTIDLPENFRHPIRLHVHGSSAGLIMPINSDDNKPGHGPRIHDQSEPASKPTPERSPAPVTAASAPFTIDRSDMLSDPISWLRRLDVELRYLSDYTPHGRYIFDYLTVGESARKVDDLADELSEVEASSESSEEKVREYEKLITKIVESFESTEFDGIESAAHFLHDLKETLTNADILNVFDHPKVHHRLESFEEIAVPKSEADFESLKAERDQLQARTEALAKELAHAKNRITAYEIAAKQRQADADHRAASQPERSPTPVTEPMIIPFATRPPVLSRNGPKNGIELRFDGKPTDLTRDAMKALGFRWAPGQPDKPWIAKYTEERWIFATALAEGKSVEPATPLPEILGIEQPADAGHCEGSSPPDCQPVRADIFAFADF